MREQIKKHFINLRGKNLKERILVIESDDWGAIRIPDQATQSELICSALIQKENPFSKYDCLESTEDYQALYEVLGKFKDCKGNSPVLTANMVMANPDFHSIELSKFQEYTYEHFSKTYQSYYPSLNTFQALKEGIENGCIYPQFHAREHLNVQRWMDKLSSGDPAFRRAFELKCFAIDDVDNSNQRENLMATYDYESATELKSIQKGIEEGLQLFQETFGSASRTHIAPCYVWNEFIEKFAHANGVYGIQGSKFQQYKDPGFEKHKRIWRYMGQTNERNQIYTIRNVLFEPALNHRIGWVDKAMESIAIAFFWQKPAIIGSHRINYVGGLSEANRTNTLIQLNELLGRVLKKWPNVQFLNSAQLTEKLRLA